MPQIEINSSNIKSFGFSLKFNIYTRQLTFDISGLTVFNGSGATNVLGICFSLQQEGIELANGGIDFLNPQIPAPIVTNTWTLDLSSMGIDFLFDDYRIVGAIKDSDGTIYQTVPVIKTICKPVNLTEAGYVPGMFQVLPNCPDNVLTVKELTLLIYNNQKPISVTKNGTLYYPTGTISPVVFTGTPFSNNNVYTGQNKVDCTTVAEYDLLDNIFVDVTYLTKQQFPVTCNNFLGNLSCCLSELTQTYLKNCGNAIGENAKQKSFEILLPLMNGVVKQINGQDASFEVALIKKTLDCDCGSNSLVQNEMTPINPSVTSIVLSGVGGTSIASPTITGDTKSFVIVSNSYQVVKGNTGDLAFTIDIDTSTQYVVKFKITFNYEIFAGYILTAIAGNDTLLAQLNSLITFTNFNIDLTNLNGKCVIDISSVNYFLSFKVPSGAAQFKNIVINGTTYTPGSPINVSNADGISLYLNGLGLGTFEVSFSNSITGSYINILTDNNANTVTNATLTIGGSDTVVIFQKTVKSLIAVLQAIIDYLCGLTAFQVALGNTLSLCYFDYNGNIITQTYPDNTSQGAFNLSVSTVICNIANRIFGLTGLTCTKLKTIFNDYPNAVIGSPDRFLTIVDGNCMTATNKQVALSVIAAVSAYADVKSAFCAINCNEPATCPDVSAINLAMSGSNIGVYGLTWGTTPLAVQTVTVRYKLHSSSVWIVSTNALMIFPNGNISGTTPYLIINPTAGQTYDVWITNNCGGTGFVSQITVPTGSVYTGVFLIDNIIYNICGAEDITLYSSAPFGTGVIMYTDIGLTTPLTGETYIADKTVGAIYQINSSTGLVGVNTGSNCSTGTAGRFKLDTITGTICGQSPVFLFTDGNFAPGKTIYYDSALTSPVTGFNYLERLTDSGIYNLDSSTGVIGIYADLSCGSNTVTIDNNTGGSRNIVSIGGISGFTLSSPLPAGSSEQGTHNAFTAVISIGATSGVGTDCGSLYKNGVLQQAIPVSSGTFNFSSAAYLITDNIQIILTTGACP